MELPFIPDIFLFGLPYFWALSIYKTAGTCFFSWKIPFLIVFSVSTLFIFFRKLYKNVSRETVLGMFLSILFVLGFSALLHLFFSPFTKVILKKVLIDSFLFFGGIPIVLASIGPKKLNKHSTCLSG